MPQDTTAPCHAADPGSTAPPTEIGERIVGGRYRLQTSLGRGGYGEVWIADDRLAGAAVAIKLLSVRQELEPARVRREIAALRLLRVPGVVRLLDEGTEDGVPYVVMELVDGVPFPGCGIPATWAAIEDSVIALLETIGRIHAAGVVHRDLKPANILVTAGNAPVVLDFGLSSGRPLGGSITESGIVLGTPGYLAPEQLTGGSGSFASDLYSLGVILYEALVGGLPHGDPGMQSFLPARLTQPHLGIASAASAVPPHVAAVVDALLAREPEHRPSCAAVLRALRARSEPTHDVPALPWVGSNAVVTSSLEHLRAGKSVIVVGPPGSGRTRCLAEVTAALRCGGARVVTLVPHHRPLASLEPAIGVLDPGAPTLAEAQLVARSALAEQLESGTVVVADGLDRLDAWSLEVIASCGATPNLLLSAAEAVGSANPVILAPLSATDLRALFDGAERIFHIPEDAAAALFERSGGLPRLVAEELEAWVRAGVAHRSGARFAITRHAIDRLRSGVERGGRPKPLSLWRRSTSSAQPELKHELRDLVAWLLVVWPHATLPLLAAITGEPAWRLDADLGVLVDARFVQRREGRVYATEAAAGVAAQWPADKARRAHRAVARALVPATPGRLDHLLLAADEHASNELLEEIATEAQLTALRLARAGAPGMAMVALQEALGVLRGSQSAQVPSEIALLGMWVLVALREGTPQALDRVMFDLQRCASEEARSLEALVRAALSALSDRGDKALDMASHVPPFASSELELCRRNLQALAARRCAETVHADTVKQLCRWAESRGEADVAAAALSWRARLSYRLGDFADAARLFFEAAEREPWPTTRIEEMLLGAAALMETFAHRDAAVRAREARDAAARLRLPAEEAWSEWAMRAALYRAGENLVVDQELIDAVRQLGIGELTALVCFTEAVVGYRRGERQRARELAGEAERAWKSMGKEWTAMLAGALQAACGAPLTDAQIGELARAAMRCPVKGLGIQALGLLGRVATSNEVSRLAATVPHAHWDERMDVLSVREALESLERANQAQPGG